MRYQDGENVRYTCENSVYRFPKYDGTPKKDWIDTLGMFSKQLQQILKIAPPSKNELFKAILKIEFFR